MDIDLADPFLIELLRVIRSQDYRGTTMDGKSEASLLAPFIVTREQLREMPLIDDPDPDILWRVEMFYTAVGLAIERRTGLIASPMMKMSHEGFGRVLLTAGRLVVLAATLRDVHRFGFETVAKLAERGRKLVDDGVEAINRYPEVANA